MIEGTALRPAGAGDTGFLREMLAAAAFWQADAPSVSADEVLADPALARYVAGWPRDGDLGVVAERSRPVGAAWLRLFDPAEPGYGFVSASVPELSMAVVPGWRGRGLGGALLDAVVVAARARRLAAVSLSVAADNHAARRLYDRAGFRDTTVSGGSHTMLLVL